jgi:SpoVK/Ycf46/Vps4 family AAA+-type ATPase
LAVRRSGGDSSVADRVLSQILSEMDGIEPLVNVTIIAATNRPDILDSALLRPGRIDSMLYVDPPNEKSRKCIFENKLKNIPTKNVNPSELAKLTDGFSGAETVQVIQTACLLAMKTDVEVIDNEYFLEAIKSITKRITPEMIQFYEDFREKSGLRSV